MKKFALITAVLTALMFMGIPTDSTQVSAQDRGRHKRHSSSSMNPVRWPRGKGDPRWAGSWNDRNRRNDRSFRDFHGYRNYGQYRRTQVGNRRWRHHTRHHSWQNNGGFIRRSRRSY
jgi:hypothetical protein